MSLEESIKNELVKKFLFLEGKIRAPRARRIFIDDIIHASTRGNSSRKKDLKITC